MPTHDRHPTASSDQDEPQPATRTYRENDGVVVPSSNIASGPSQKQSKATTRVANLSSLNTSPSSPPKIILSSPSNPSSPVTLSSPSDEKNHAGPAGTTQASSSPEHSRSWRKTKDTPATASPKTESSNAARTGATEQSQHPKAAITRDRRAGKHKDMVGQGRWARSRSPWACSILTVVVTTIAAVTTFIMMQSFLTRQLDPKGCAMSMMRPAFARFTDFDTEHSRFASKYSLYLYREAVIDEDTRVKGVPVLFIPGNAGSYKQVRPLAAQAAVHFHENYQFDPDAAKKGKVALDVFTVDFNEDITAFHGQTMLDQAEYLNEVVAYILSLYHNPHRSIRDSELPDPTSVILVGHSMGGIVARTMLTMPNYVPNSVNTILTLAAPHSRAPVSFDAEIVRTYKNINEYWKNAYSQQWANNNPLRHVTLISIAGGSLDTLVPSEYAAVSSIVPPTHGFAVFTSTIPSVWTGMDHLAITWCDQLRKSVIPALYDIVDGRRSTQTLTRADRMRSFKRWLLTGLEDIDERQTNGNNYNTLLFLEENTEHRSERLSRLHLGGNQSPKVHLLSPKADSSDITRFSLLTNQPLQFPNNQAALEILLCVPSSASPNPSSHFTTTISLSQSNNTQQPSMSCKNAAEDRIHLPASTGESQFPFDSVMPFSYLQYDLSKQPQDVSVVAIDRNNQPNSGWAIAEFSSQIDSTIKTQGDMKSVVKHGIELSLSPDRPMMNEIQIPSVHSSLLAYKLKLKKQSCQNNQELFMPFVRQYISEPYESKYFVNVEQADISMHGVAPYVPQLLEFQDLRQGLSLQIWSDPTCNNALDVSLTVDILGSLGKLWMRYRTVFAAFPLVIVALVLRKQFKVYDESGVFISFSESIAQSLKTSIPLLYISFTILGVILSTSSKVDSTKDGPDISTKNLTFSGLAESTKHDLLLGSQDAYFWFLVPLFGIISIGVCVLLNYTVLVLTHLFAFLYIRISRIFVKHSDAREIGFPVSSFRKRLITTGVLLLLVATLIPYQFVFMVLCVVQLVTSVRALNYAHETKSGQTSNFYNYAHSILLLLLWILPINLPVFVVWIHNLAVHWLTPFSSHHNILSIMPFVFLVETQGTGRMIPRVKSRLFSHVTGLLLMALGTGSAIYGVSYAYLLHVWVNLVVCWLTCLHLSGSEKVQALQLNNVFAPQDDGNDSPTEKARLKQEEGKSNEIKKKP